MKTPSLLSTHWHGFACLEIQVRLPHGPLLFRQLSIAAKRIKHEKLAAGATSSYASIGVYWQRIPADRTTVQEQIETVIHECLDVSENDTASHVSQHLIPASYDGPDLEEVAALLELTQQEVIRRHVDSQFVVAAVGFTPNFSYLWGLDPTIEVPRRPSPRVRVSQGAVGLAGRQSGIYPAETPGGWQLIAHVDPVICEQVCPKMQVGDIVRFEERRRS